MKEFPFYSVAANSYVYTFLLTHNCKLGFHLQITAYHQLSAMSCRRMCMTFSFHTWLLWKKINKFMD